MDAMKTWTVQVDVDEHEDSTRAVTVYMRVETGPWTARGSRGSTP